ncbi:LLM class flavin-dependent oxidoreductase [Nocardia sp. BMG111209]|uniref:LLM class flavin-dependent oxidoreductase n=1 Tax=Nocardia sp. BMG111209 TaxID=1160137 RepID=UPI00035C0C92|nr:LLM class flavin-dependent oxidoreductase [Nocardia sp. BMG111209]
MTLRIGVAPHRLWAATESELDDVVESARLAERLGFDHLIAGSHVLDTELGPTLEPLTMLSVIAGATSRIRLATSVLILPLYHPVVLANQTATLDRLSRGRFTLGVGTGWHAGEFEAVGAPFAERGRRADEYLATLRTLWDKGSAEVKIAIAPRTAGGPEVWVGGGSAAALRRSVRFGDAWHGSGLDPQGLRETRIRLRELADREQRPEPAVTLGGFLVPPGFEAAV